MKSTCIGIALLFAVPLVYGQQWEPSPRWEPSPTFPKPKVKAQARPARQAQPAQPAYGGRSVQMQEKSTFTGYTEGGAVVTGINSRGEVVNGVSIGGERVTGTTTRTRTVSCGQLKAEWDQHRSLLDRMETAGPRYQQWYARNEQYEQKFVHECE